MAKRQKRAARETAPETTERTADETQATGIPAPSGGVGTGTRRPFLKYTEIGAVGERGTLQLDGDAKLVDGEFGEQILVDVTFKRQPYVWGINVNSMNHRYLFEKFGSDPKQWTGTIKVFVKSGTYSPFLAIVSK